MKEFPEFDAALGEVLVMLVEDEAPPSTVSAAEAVRQGRARVRRRRAAVVGAVAAIAVTAGALGALPAGGGGDAAPGLPAASPSSSPVAPSRLPSPTMSGSPWASPTGPHPLPTKTVVAYPGQDPMSGAPRFGWLPDDLSIVSYWLEPTGNMLRAASPVLSGTRPTLSVTLFPVGTAPRSQMLPPEQAKLVPAPPVNGQEAHWVTTDDPAGAKIVDELEWKLPDGRWADLDASYLKDSDRQQVPLKVAAALDTQPHDTPLPVRVTGLPAEYTVSSATFDRSTSDPKSWSLMLTFSVSYDKYFGISVKPDGPSQSPSPSASASASGGPQVMERPHVCKSEQGLRICVESLQDPNAVFAAVGGMDAMLPKITGLGMDESNWTTGVIG